MNTENEDIQRQILKESVDHIYAVVPVTSANNVLLTIVIAIILWEYFPPDLLLTWLALSTLLFAYRIYIWRGYRSNQEKDDAALLVWRRRYSRSVLYQGLIWGSAGLLFFVPDHISLQVLLISIIIGISVTILAIVPYCRSAFFNFAITSNSMLAARLYWEGDGYGNLATGVVVCVTMLSIYALRAGGTVREAVRLRFENQALVERLHEEKERAEEASRVKTKFLASASHDLRQPVHSLSLFCEALDSEITTNRGREIVEHLQGVVSSLSGLLSSLLDISRLDAGIVKPQFVNTSLEHITNTMLREFQATAEEKGLQLRIHGCQQTIHTDPDLLANILRNLVANAVRYTESGGVLLSCRQRGKDLLIQVWDTGIGIPKTSFTEIFQEFNQLHNPERDRNQGLGLGLAICQRLADLMGYSLSLRSREGKGSVFEVYLPEAFVLSSAEQQIVQNIPELPADILQGRTVLVIDDELSVREATHALLSGWGISVLLADGVEQAVAIASEKGHELDAIVSDYRLRSHEQGVDAVQAVQQIAGKTIPAILITGDTAPERIREARDSGYTLIHKPIKAGYLRSFLVKSLAV